MRLAARWLVEGQAAGASLLCRDRRPRPASRIAGGGRSRRPAGPRPLGLPHRILTWQGAKPESRIQERARAARYALLGAHARELGADYLLTAHHADDQAETILFRLLRGSGLAGLAGMSGEIMLGSIMLYRPLLTYSKKTLIDYCEACDQPYFRDPSNENYAFARTRLRALLPLVGRSRAQRLRAGAARTAGGAGRAGAGRPNRNGPRERCESFRRTAASVFPPRLWAIAPKRSCAASSPRRSPLSSLVSHCGSTGSKGWHKTCVQHYTTGAFFMARSAA